MAYKPMPIITRLDLTRFWSKVRKTDYCWFWLGKPDTEGYGCLSVNGVIYKAHRLSYWIHNYVDPREQQVQHTCNNPICVNQEHLMLGDDCDNAQHRTLSGNSHQQGAQNGNAKLTEELAQNILNLRGKLTIVEIGKYYSINHRTVSAIHTGKTWKHLKRGSL